MLLYSQSTGVLCYAPSGENPRILARGYSGHPPYVNDAAAQARKAAGPIPRGRYRVGHPFDHVRLGRVVFYLDPHPANEMFGRSGFFIHGDNRYGNRTASHGCIVVNRAARDEVAKLVAIAPPGGLWLEVIK
jgi:lipoprotein-anchoring transpeptidase ErfK/SrfK